MGQSRQSKLAFVLILAVLLLPCAVLAQQAPSPLVQGVGPIEITVSDMDRVLKFYSEVLSFEKVSDQNVDDTNYLGWKVHRHRAYGWCGCGSGMNTSSLCSSQGRKAAPFPPTRVAMIAGFSTSPLS